MSLALATKGVICRGTGISVTVTGPPGTETVYLIEMGIDVELETLDVAIKLDDFDVAIDIEEDGWVA
jgi:hypothetical protein